MGKDAIAFKDGAAYDRYMGKWSRLAGKAFLDWLAPEPGLRWLDVGCGNGAFTGMLIERCAPAAVEGIDPSEQQLEYARARPELKSAVFRQADAMALPYPGKAFDAAVMPLVIFFVPEPEKGVSEMARVVGPRGLVTAYSWDMPGGGFPYAVLQSEMREMGLKVPSAPRPEASRIEVLEELWAMAGLESIGTASFAVRRDFENFEEYWSVALGGPSVGPTLAGMASADIERLQARLREKLPSDASGRLRLEAKANAVRGRVKVP